jgi:hypothetical protein
LSGTSNLSTAFGATYSVTVASGKSVTVSFGRQ